MSFGSMAAADEEGLAAVALEAARLAGIRVLLVSEWSGFAAVPRKAPRLQQKKRICGVVTGTSSRDDAGGELPPNVMVVDRSVPVQFLLAHCALAVHCACTLWTGPPLPKAPAPRPTSAAPPPPPPPLPRTNRTSLVPPLVLIGHAAPFTLAGLAPVPRAPSPPNAAD